MYSNLKKREKGSYNASRKLPKMRYDENGKPLFDSGMQAEKNILNPKISFLARHEEWRTERMRLREKRKSAPIVWSKIYTSCEDDDLEETVSLDAFASSSSSDKQSGHVQISDEIEQKLKTINFHNKEKGEVGGGDISLDGFEFVHINIYILTGQVQGEGYHRIVGKFLVEGKISGVGFKTTNMMKLTFLWHDPRYHHLSINAITAEDWTTLRASTPSREKMKLQIMPVDIETETLANREYIANWAVRARLNNNLKCHNNDNAADDDGDGKLILPNIHQNMNNNASQKSDLASMQDFLGIPPSFGDDEHVKNKKNNNDEAEDDKDEEDDEEVKRRNGGPVILALPKGPMNYLQHNKHKLRYDGWMKSVKDPWVTDPKPDWECACGSINPPKAPRCSSCDRDQEGFDAAGFDGTGYDREGFNKEGKERSVRERLALARSKSMVGSPTTPQPKKRATTSDLLKSKTSILRSCPKCYYVGSSPRCPFCSGVTVEATRAERLVNLAERIVGNAQAIPGDSKLGQLVPTQYVGISRNIKKGDYIRQKVAGMLTGIGNYRNNGCRTWLVAFGGRDAKMRVLNTTEVLSPGATSWRNGGAMKVGRAQAACTAVGLGRVYAVGGVDHFGIRLNSVEYLDIQSGEWRLTAPLLIPRSGAVAAEVAGKLIVVGGRSNRELGVVATVECLDPADVSSVFQYLPSISLARDRSGGAVVRKQGQYQLNPWHQDSCQDTEVLVICGGMTSGGKVSARVDIYDPKKNEWSRAADMPEGRYGCVCCAHNGYVYVIGGLGLQGIADPNIILVYNASKDQWITQSSSSSTKNNVGIPIRTAVDHVPIADRVEDDTYYGGRDGAGAAVFEGNRIALVGGVGANSECFGTVDILTPFPNAPRPNDGVFKYATGDAQRGLPNSFALQPTNGQHNARLGSELSQNINTQTKKQESDDSDDGDDDDDGIWPMSPQPLQSMTVEEQLQQQLQTMQQEKPGEIQMGGGNNSISQQEYLPLWFNGLPPMRTRRGWHGVVGLERFQPEIAKLASDTGLTLWDPSHL